MVVEVIQSLCGKHGAGLKRRYPLSDQCNVDRVHPRGGASAPDSHAHDVHVDEHEHGEGDGGE